MIKFIKSFILFTAVLLLSWLLPWAYDFVFSKPFESPLTLYSCVTHDFLTFEFQKDDVGGYDMEGNSIGKADFDSLMPTVCYFELNKAGRLPEEIEGIPYNLRKVEHSNFVFRSFPHYYNRPEIGLYQLFDATTAKTGLKVPDDVFRATGTGLEFIRMKDNTLDREKSELYTKVLKDNGFVFPARYLNNDNDTQKHYDNGFLMVDQRGRLFQLKRLKEEPMCRMIETPDSMVLTHAFVTEFKDRRLLGFLRDEKGGFYALEADDLSIHRLPTAPFDPKVDQMVISGDMFYWNIIRETKGYEHIDALDARNYQLVKTHETYFPDARWEKARNYVFPFRLVFESASERYTRPHFRDFSFLALGTNLLLALIWFFMQKRTKLLYRSATSAGILILGFYLFIPLLLTAKK